MQGSSLTCKRCSQPYDCDKYARTMYICGHSTCKECFLGQRQAQEDRVKCPFDNKVFDQNFNELSIDLGFQELLKTVKYSGILVKCINH
jgi:hypothetical protein